MSVKDAFGKYALVYDETRRKFIPCFDEFYGMALRLLPRDLESPRILDLGAGTGLMSAMVLEAFPHARLVLADISDAMLDQARERFENKPGPEPALPESKTPEGLLPESWLPEFQVLDYTRQLPDGPFDAVVSALSIHHLTHGEKQGLFQRIHGSLAPGGIFINADQALGETPEMDAYYRECWFERVRAAGITEEEMAGARERMKEDKMSTLAHQLDWMQQAGFTGVNCWYKWYNFVVYSGKKGPE